MNKGTVTVTLGIFDNYMSLDAMEETIREARQRASTEGLSYLRVEIEGRRSYYDDVDVTATIYGMRYETDEEAAIRMHAAANRQQQTEAQERETYERLRQKYGDAPQHPAERGGE